MKLRTAFTAIALSFAASLATAQPTSGAVIAADSQPGRVTLVEAIRVSATVTALDKDKRQVTLKGPEGGTRVVTAGPEVRNFDQIRIGDVVVARYIETLTLQLKKGTTGARERVESESGAAAKAGARPAGMVEHELKVVADVIAVDAKKQTVKVRGPKRTMDLQVRDPEQFKLIKVGDQIEATIVETIALSVEPGAKAAK